MLCIAPFAEVTDAALALLAEVLGVLKQHNIMTGLMFDSFILNVVSETVLHRLHNFLAYL